MMIDLFCAEVRDYEGLRHAVRARIEQLNISRLCLDEVAGLPPGYCGKVLATGDVGDTKRFGMLSLGLVLQAAGLKMLLVDDRDALTKVEPMYERRQARQVRTGHRSSDRFKKKRRR
jgi:hypothetical protein